MQPPQAPALRGFASKLLEIPAVSSQWLRFFADLPSLPPRRPFSFYLSIFSFYFYFSLLIPTTTTSLSLPGLSLRPLPGPKKKKKERRTFRGRKRLGSEQRRGEAGGGLRSPGACWVVPPSPPDPPGRGAAGRTDGWTDRPPGGCTARPAAAEGNPSMKPPLSAPSLLLPGGDPPWRPLPGFSRSPAGDPAPRPPSSAPGAACGRAAPSRGVPAALPAAAAPALGPFYYYYYLLIYYY